MVARGQHRSMSQDLRFDVTTADIRAAKEAWQTARYGDAPAERVRQLRRELEQLWRLEARQVQEEFWRGRRPGPR